MPILPKPIPFLLKLLTALTIATLLLAVIQINLVLRPQRVIAPGNTLREEGIAHQAVTLTTQDGVPIAAWYTAPRNGVVILLAHGYGDNRPEAIHAMLAKTGYGVLSWDARAHGESGGELSTIGYLEVWDVKAALDFALAQPDVRHIGAWGGSMGAATLIRAGANFPEIEAFFLDSSFTSLDEELNYLVPLPILNPLAKFIAQAQTGVNIHDIDPLRDIAVLSPRPVYIVHGTADTVAPPDAGERLYNAAHEPRFLWQAENIGHMLIYQDNPRRYKTRLIRFFDEWLLGD